MSIFKKPEPTHIFLNLPKPKIRKEISEKEIIDMPQNVLRDGAEVRSFFSSLGFDPDRPIRVLHDPVRAIYIFEQEKK